MKKIGVFGDSYAANWNKFIEPYWSNILLNEYGHNIQNHAYGGTGLDYSYRKFMQSYESYETIIFVLSHPHRRTVWELLEHTDHNHWVAKKHIERLSYLRPAFQTGAFDGWETVSRELSGQETKEQKWYERFSNKEQYGNIKKRYDQAENINRMMRKYPETYYLEYHAIIDSIMSRHDDVILIPAFDYYGECGLVNISRIDWEFYGTSKETETRYNHMSREHCEIFANLLDQRLRNKECKKWIESIDRKYVEKYYKPSMSLMDAGLTNNA